MEDNRDTQRKRLEFARWRAAFHAGRPALSGNDLTELVVQAGHKPVSASYASRVEIGERPVMSDWAKFVGKVAHVDAGWLLMFDGATEPAEYREWLEKQSGAEREEKPAPTYGRQAPIRKAEAPSAATRRKKSG